MGSAGIIRSARLRVPAALALAPDDLAVFILNVGDGDAIVVRLPVRGGEPAYVIVDSCAAEKSISLVRALHDGFSSEPRIRLMVATHPHADHTSGLKAVLAAFAAVDEFWDSGFRFTSLGYRQLLEAVEQRAGADGLRFLRPTSGFEFYEGAVRISVLSPSIALRNRYDTYGVDVNNASIVTRVSYPVDPPSAAYPSSAGQAPTDASELRARTVILGGDAQTDAWGRVLDEFPHLVLDSTNWARAIGARTGSQPLACDLFKVSHHASKRGINLELLERLGDRSGTGPSEGPPILVTSCSSERPHGFGFPHNVAQELMREVRDPVAQSGGSHRPDDELGIHFTSQTIDVPTGPSAGSVAYVIGADRSAALYRLGDAEDAPVDLGRARRVI